MSQSNGTLTEPDLIQERLTAAVAQLPDEQKRDVVSTAMGELSNTATAGLVNDAIKGLPDEQTTDVVESAVRTLPSAAQEDLMGRLAPDQTVTNDIWLWIVRTFALVLLGATLALVIGMIVSFWQDVDPATMQMLLTIFTTTAGILAGFVSGRASTTRR